MPAVEVVGWAGTVSGMVLGLPQLLRLVRTRRVDGLSLLAWRAFLVVNLIWTAHGIRIGQLPQIVTSALSLCSTVPILVLLARELQRPLLPCCCRRCWLQDSHCDRPLLGSATFGAGDHPGLLRERRPKHRAGPLQAHRRCLGAVPDSLGGEPGDVVVLGDPRARRGTMIVATATLVVTVFNLVWWSLRTLGLRPLLPPALQVRDDVTRKYSRSPPTAGRRRALTDQGCSLIRQSVPTVVIMFGQRSSRRSRLTRLAAPTLAVLLGGGCASTDLTPSAGTDPVTPASTLTPSATPTIKEAAVTDIRITVNDQIFTAQLADNPTAHDLIDQLPLTLRFGDFNHVEKIAKLPRPLTMAGVLKRPRFDAASF